MDANATINVGNVASVNVGVNLPLKDYGTTSSTTEPGWLKLSKQYPNQPVDFQVRVHVIEARELQPRDRNGMSDPVCFVSISDQKKNTVVNKKTTTCTWDHLMFFEMKMTPEEFFHEKVKVTVCDANTIFRNVEIGTFEFDTTYVYESKGHEVYRQWVALSYRNDKDLKNSKTTGVQGYLKLSVTVLGPKDTAPAHDETEENEDDAVGNDLQSMVLLPPSIKTQDYMLEVNCYKAEGLPKLDAGPTGKIDGYVAVTYGGGKEAKTEVIKNNYSPMWFEKLGIPFTMPTMSDQIKIQIKDWDRESKNDDIVGTQYVKLHEVMNGPTDWKSARWINIYGIPEGVSTVGLTKEVDLANKMNNGNIEGTCFRGRALLSINAVPTTDPKPTKFKINAPQEPPTTNYVLRFDVLEAAELQTSSDISVEVTLGLFKKESKKTKVENGNATLFQSFEDAVMALPQDITQVPDVFVNVYKHSLTNKKRIGYVRIKASDLNSKFNPQWTLLTSDIFSDVDKSQAVGFLQFNVSLGPASEFGTRTNVVKPSYKKYQLRGHIYQGRELPASDAEGTSDPYVVVRLGKGSGKTSTKKETLFPLWYETVSFSVELPEPLQYPPDIQVSVYDWDKLDADDFLGRFSVSLKNVNEKMPSLPSWHSLYAKDPTITEGAILASFQLIPEEKAKSIAIQPITPKYKNCTVEISVVGLRDLLPYNLLPINKSCVEFDFGDSKTKVRTKNCDKPNGANPNHLEKIEVDLQIPENRIYAPPVNIKVYDDRLIHKPLIATRTISLSPFIPWSTKEEIDEEKNSNSNSNSGMVALENTTPIIDKIPGALDESEIESDVMGMVPLENNNNESVSIKIEEDHESQLKAMVSVNQDLATIQDSLTTTVKDSDLQVPEKTLPGIEETEDSKGEDRETVKTELENELTQPPFNVYKIYRAKKRNGRPYKIEVGEWKGRFRVLEKGVAAAPAIDLLSLYKPKTYVVRAYILEGFQLVPKDKDGNNPYLRITLGKTKIKDVDNTKQSTCRPGFYKCYEIPCVFPDETVLNVECWDYDRFTPHDLIGTTRIDLEARYYSDQWKQYKQKPFEYRTLWNPSSSNPQGQIRLYIDILTQEEAARIPQDNIMPPVPQNYEMRVIVWETKNVILKNSGGKSSDIIVVGYPEGQEPQSTDTHWNSKDGQGLFNWRLKYPITVPNPKPRFKLQVWDRNVLTPNGAICEANLNLKPWFLKSWKGKMQQNSIEKQWVSMTHPTATGCQGEILVEFELLSIDEAKRRPAGFGRDEPNENPHLDPPNRPADSLAPWAIGSKLALGLGKLWGASKYKLLAAGICCIIILIIIIVLWLKFWL